MTANLRYCSILSIFAFAGLMLCANRAAHAADDRPAFSSAGDAFLADDADFTEMSLEQLMTLQVVTVGEEKQRYASTAAASTVITPEEIRRSGFSNLPELLRLAPGMNVSRTDASNWTVSARGFSDLYSNYLLVLVDGRQLYQPLFGGVHWYAQDMVLEDIEQIDVIRGPGGALYGANAVNGVVNITTKDAKDTQGAMLSGRGATDEQIGAVRYGGQIDEKTYYRLYTKYRNIDDFPTPDGSDGHGGQEAERAGFRLDRHETKWDVLTVEGEYFDAISGNTIAVPTFTPPFAAIEEHEAATDTGYLLARWDHAVSEKSGYSLQLYYDRFDEKASDLVYRGNTLDLDLMHRFALSDRNAVIWGAGYRFQADDVHGWDDISFNPRRRDTYLISAFVQDDMTIVPDRLHVFAGSKFEVNSYTGFEIQPSLRAIWTPNDRNAVWGAVSRAVRTPMRLEDSGRLTFQRIAGPMGMPTTVDVFGSQDFQSEELLTFETGYRIRPTPTTSFDIAGFYNLHDHYRSLEAEEPFIETTPSPVHLVVPAIARNNLKGESFGVEAATTWRPSDAWRLAASYTWLEIQFHQDDIDPDSEAMAEDSAPHNQFQVHSYYDITRNLEFNASLYYVDNIPQYDVPAYVRVDGAITWRPKTHLEVSAGVQNIFDNQHPEWGSRANVMSAEVPRSVYVQLTWRF